MTNRNRALDGLRALAVAAVMLYHFPTKQWVPGGWIGVDVFFVLSGYLITTQLLARPRTAASRGAPRVLRAPGPPPAAGTGRAARDLARRRRPGDVRRPVSAWPAGEPLTSHDLPRMALRLALIAVLLVNWHIALDPTPPTDPLVSLDSLWSLSLEEQFYLAWPPVVLGLNRRWLALITACAAAVSAALPALLAHGDPHAAQRVYFGTDTRCQALAVRGVAGPAAPAHPADQDRPARVRCAGGGRRARRWCTPRTSSPTTPARRGR